MEQNKKLDEVSFIRPILIIILVLYHAFAPWCDAWRPFDGFQSIDAYWWIGKSAYSFMLPMFVFISGYVWSYQRESLKRLDGLKALVRKKFMRLIIPSILLSVAYMLIFNKFTTGRNLLINNIITVISGYAHMWFLPMLFWCFIISWFILRLKRNWQRWMVIIALMIFSIIPLPFQLGTSFYYIFFFYLGYRALSVFNLSRNFKCFWITCMSWIVFAIIFVLLTIFIKRGDQYIEQVAGLKKAFCMVLLHVAQVSYSVLGIGALWITSLLYTQRHKVSPLVVKLGEYCFGVYLIQQFVLQYLYYHTLVPSVIGNIVLPWFGFIITLIVSLIISYLVRLTPFGRKVF